MRRTHLLFSAVLVLIPGAVIVSIGTPVNPSAPLIVDQVPARIDGQLSVTAKGSAPVRRELTSRPDSRVDDGDLAVETVETVAGVELRPDLAHVMTGRIFGSRGDPIGGALVAVRLGPAEDAPAGPQRQSDAGGYFRIEALPKSDRLQVTVSCPGFLPYGRQHRSDAKNLQVTLTPTRSVFGRVLDCVTGAPVTITGVQLLTSSSKGGPWRTLGKRLAPAQRSAPGEFRIPLNIHCYARVLACGTDRASVISDPFWMGRADVGPILLNASKGVELAGRLLDERDRPVPDAVVDILAEKKAKDLVRAGAPVVLARCRSQADGGFRTSPLAVGRYDIRVRRAGYLHLDRPVEVGKTATGMLELVVGRAGVVRGRLRANPRHARKRWRVVARPTSPTAKTGPRTRCQSAQVGQDGFVFDALEPGSYELQLYSLATGTRADTPSVAVQVEAARESVVILEFDAAASARPTKR